MTKHTPGPWEWWDESTGRPRRYDLASLNGKNGKRVLGCYGGSGINALGKSEEDRANALLIAAAPELLEALKALRNWCDEEINGAPPECRRIMGRADAAIRKSGAQS
jgi:hypothetical protein